MEDGDDSYFSSDINSLCSELINTYPQITDVSYPIEELLSYSNKLLVAKDVDEREKYYQLSIGRLLVLETKAERAGAL